MISIEGRLAGAPISWGVCEVPGWGAMLPPDRVLAEMRGLGLSATELGPVGYLGDTPDSIHDRLTRFDLGAVAGFVPVVLHDVNARTEMRLSASRAAKLLEGAGASFFVTAVVVDEAWSAPYPLSQAEWRTLVEGLELVEQICAAHGLVQVIHPHVGTLVERKDDVDFVLEHSSASWCLDTGHLTIGGVDPVAFATDHADRVALVHLKDVNLDIAQLVRSGESSLLDATKAGLFQALGRGGVQVSTAVRALEKGGYAGWYVLEQDVTIDEDAAATANPAADVLASIEYLRGI